MVENATWPTRGVPDWFLEGLRDISPELLLKHNPSGPGWILFRRVWHQSSNPWPICLVGHEQVSTRFLAALRRSDLQNEEAEKEHFRQKRELAKEERAPYQRKVDMVRGEQEEISLDMWKASKPSVGMAAPLVGDGRLTGLEERINKSDPEGIAV